MRLRRRHLRTAVLGLVVAELVYVVAANAFLGTPLADRVINRRPEKLKVEWRRAWTVIPGIVSLDGVSLRAQNRSVQWYLTLDRGSVGVVVPALLGRRFSLAWVDGSGLDFRLRRRRDRGVELEPPVAGHPEIPGLDNPPATKPEDLYPRKEHRRARWSIRIDDVAIDDVRSLWIDRARLVGDTSVAGSFEFQIGGPFELPAATLSTSGGQLILGDEATAEDLELEVSARFDPFEPRNLPAREVFRHISGDLAVSGRVTSLGFVDEVLRDAPWLAVDGAGVLAAEIGLDRGSLTPGSRLEVEAKRLATSYFAYTAEGRGTLTADVTTAADPELLLRTDLEDISIQTSGWDRPHVSGTGFHVRATTSQLNLADELSDLDVELMLPSAKIEDWSIYGSYLPAGLGLSIDSGHGTIAGRLHAARDGPVEGELDLSGEALRGSYSGRGLSGRVTVQTRLRGGDVDARTFDLGGTRLELSDVVLEADPATAEEPWWAHVELTNARLDAGSALDMSADLRVAMRDSGPIAELLAEEKKLLEVVDGLLTVRDVHATAAVRSHQDHLVVRRLAVAGEGLEILGDLSMSPAGKRGLLFARYRKLSAAVHLTHVGIDWKVLRSRRWFEGRRADLVLPEPAIRHDPRRDH